MLQKTRPYEKLKFYQDVCELRKLVYKNLFFRLLFNQNGINSAVSGWSGCDFRYACFCFYDCAFCYDILPYKVPACRVFNKSFDFDFF